MFSLPPELLVFQARCREFGRTHITPRAAALDAAPVTEFPWDLAAAGGRAGMLDVMIPEDYGGLGLGLMGYCIQMEELCAADSGAGTIFGAHGLGLGPVFLSGDADLFDRLFPELVASARTDRPALMAYAITEPGIGTDAQYQREGEPEPVRTVARRVPGGYLLNGAKKFISNGSAARYVSTMATLDPAGGYDDTVALLVRSDSPGFVVALVEQKTGQRACPAAELHFHDVFVPETHRIGPEGSGWHLGTTSLVYGRGVVAAVAVGIAQNAYDIALDYARTRRQGGQPIVMHQAVRLMLADMRIQIEAARLMTRSACWAMDHELPPPVAPSSMAKVFASDVAMKVTTDAVQIMGGRGYMRDQPLERLMRDAKVTQIYEGANQLLRLFAMQDEIEDLLPPVPSGAAATRRTGRPALA